MANMNYLSKKPESNPNNLTKFQMDSLTSNITKIPQSALGNLTYKDCSIGGEYLKINLK